MWNKLVPLSVVALTFNYLALAYEPSPLQDFCVADSNSSVKVNGVTCKNPMQVQAEDFFFSGLHLRGNTSNQLGSKVTPVFATQLPGLNTLGISMVLQKGDVFVFPVGLVHFQRNVGNGNAVVIAALSSQNPGAITIGNAVFGANPSIPWDILARAFQVDKSVVDQLQAKF
ncbi:unnamed protein product [Lactuca saligna]|uniref:Germin-like protein n=1 Tax=Lactuca saligna TaxID=75948 RepID=A0AA35UYI2_LACSI|nr:unnamed protein product [Lactuca saligna]